MIIRKGRIPDKHAARYTVESLLFLREEVIALLAKASSFAPIWPIIRSCAILTRGTKRVTKRGTLLVRLFETCHFV